MMILRILFFLAIWASPLSMYRVENMRQHMANANTCFPFIFDTIDTMDFFLTCYKRLFLTWYNWYNNCYNGLLTWTTTQVTKRESFESQVKDQICGMISITVHAFTFYTKSSQARKKGRKEERRKEERRIKFFPMDIFRIVISFLFIFSFLFLPVSSSVEDQVKEKNTGGRWVKGYLLRRWRRKMRRKRRKWVRNCTIFIHIIPFFISSFFLFSLFLPLFFLWKKVSSFFHSPSCFHAGQSEEERERLALVCTFTFLPSPFDFFLLLSLFLLLLFCFSWFVDIFRNTVVICSV